MKKKRGSKPARRKRPALRKTQSKKQRRNPTVVRRSLSQINYDHWWQKHDYWNVATTLSRDEQKAAVFYEAYRRCPVLQHAWLKRVSGPQAMVKWRWQTFVATVLNHVPQTWIQLPLFLRRAITIQPLPEMLPPVGYSVWPSEPFYFDPQSKPPKDDSETQEEYEERWRPETKEEYHERCRGLAAKIVKVPSRGPEDAIVFWQSMSRLADDGFVIAAIDNKSREAFNYAIQFLERKLKGSRRYRVADLYWRWPDKAADLGQLRQREAIGENNGIWAEWRAIGKRVRKSEGRDLVSESNVFNFRELCKGLERYDETRSDSDLMSRLRLGLTAENG
jgi:hypothetical protein